MFLLGFDEIVGPVTLFRGRSRQQSTGGAVWYVVRTPLRIIRRQNRVLDPKFICENPEIVKHATLAKRLASPELVDAWLAADATRRNSQTQFAPAKRAEETGRTRRETQARTEGRHHSGA
jgi:hypothetical protein